MVGRGRKRGNMISWDIDVTHTLYVKVLKTSICSMHVHVHIRIAYVHACMSTHSILTLRLNTSFSAVWSLIRGRSCFLVGLRKYKVL